MDRRCIHRTRSSRAVCSSSALSSISERTGFLIGDADRHLSVADRTASKPDRRLNVPGGRVMRRSRRAAVGAVLFLGIIALATGLTNGQTAARPVSTFGGEWPTYSGDLRSTRY